MSFDKLGHLDPADEQQLAFDTRPGQWPLRLVPGPAVLPLASLGTHNAAMVRCAPGTQFHPHRHFGREEIYVVDGHLCR